MNPDAAFECLHKLSAKLFLACETLESMITYNKDFQSGQRCTEFENYLTVFIKASVRNLSVSELTNHLKLASEEQIPDRSACKHGQNALKMWIAILELAIEFKDSPVIKGTSGAITDFSYAFQCYQETKGSEDVRGIHAAGYINQKLSSKFEKLKSDHPAAYDYKPAATFEEFKPSVPSVASFSATSDRNRQQLESAEDKLKI